MHRNLFSGFSIIHWEDLQNQTIIFANNSTTLFSKASILLSDRKHISAFVGRVEELRTWTSQEVVHNLPGKDRPSTLPARYVLTPCSRPPTLNPCSPPLS